MENIQKGAASLTVSLIEDLKLAASRMRGVARRLFFAEMTLKYCEGSARKAETLLGWGRETIKKGLAEKRSGIVCIGAQAARSGAKCWEEKFPEVAQMLWKLAESHAQQDPTFKSALAFTRLTAAQALEQLRKQGVDETQLPSLSSMARILNRNGYRLRRVVKAKPQKKNLKLTPSLPTSRQRMRNHKTDEPNA